MSPNLTLYAALALYAAGTIVALATLFTREKRPQHIALGMMIAGFVMHTLWISTICVRTHHPPLTNLPEAAGLAGTARHCHIWGFRIATNRLCRLHT